MNTRTAIYDEEKAFDFVKIIERFPDIYDNNKDTYRRFSTKKAWTQVAECVENEMNIECTADEAKNRWKSIRSSFTRYKLSKRRNDGKKPYKKYYLYDALKFLNPYTTSRKVVDNAEASVDEDSGDNGDNEVSINSNDYDDTLTKWSPVEVKDILSRNDKKKPMIETDEESYRNSEIKGSKRRCSNSSGADVENDDLQFFKSILPDIVNFTPKEKRRLKMGVLTLIDDIENERNEDQ